MLKKLWKKYPLASVVGTSLVLTAFVQCWIEVPNGRDNVWCNLGRLAVIYSFIVYGVLLLDIGLEGIVEKRQKKLEVEYANGETNQTNSEEGEICL